MEAVDWKGPPDEFFRGGISGQADAQKLAKDLHKFPFYFLNMLTSTLHLDGSLMKVSITIKAILKKKKNQGPEKQNC